MFASTLHNTLIQLPLVRILGYIFMLPFIFFEAIASCSDLAWSCSHIIRSFTLQLSLETTKLSKWARLGRPGGGGCAAHASPASLQSRPRCYCTRVPPPASSPRRPAAGTSTPRSRTACTALRPPGLWPSRTGERACAAPL